MSRRGWLLFVSMCLIWGLSYLFIRVAVEHMTPGTLVFLRTSIAAAILLPVAFFRDELRVALPHWRAVLAFAAIEIMIPWLLISDAEVHVTSSLAGLMIAGVPLVGAIIARVTPHSDPVNRTQLLGLLIGLVGVGALVGLDFGDLHLFAIGELLLTCVAYAVGPIILAKWLSDLPGIGVIAASLGVSALAYLPFVFVQPPELTGKVVGSLGVLSVVCTAVAFILFFDLIATIGPVRATVIAQVNPLVAVTLGVIVLSEDLTTGMLVGMPLIIGGSVLAARKNLPVEDTVSGEPIEAIPA